MYFFSAARRFVLKVERSSVDELLATWRDLGVTLSHQRRLAQIEHPPFRSAILVRKTVRGLQAVLPPPFDLLRMISRFPLLMLYRPSAVSSKLRSLRGVLGPHIVDMIDRHPRILSRDVKTVKKNIAHLQSLFPKLDAQFLITRQPSLICRSTATLAKSLSTLNTLVGPSVAQALIARQPSLLDLDIEHTVAPNIMKLQSMFPELEIVPLAKELPSLLWSDVTSTIAGKVALLLMHLPRNMMLELVTKDPRVLTRSFSVLLRLEFVRLNFPAATAPMAPLTMFAMPLAKFLDRYPTYPDFLVGRLMLVDPQRRPIDELRQIKFAELQKAINESCKNVFTQAAGLHTGNTTK